MPKTFLPSLVALALAAPVFAADYFVVVPVKGRTAAAPVESIAVSLQSATLPAAMVGQAYSYNLRDHLLVTGDKALDLNQATLTTADALPAGLSLAANGVLSGTPTVKNEAGASFQVTATYKTKTGQQVYTIVVNGSALQVLDVSAGNTHTCAVTTAGGVKCWGLGRALGNGDTTDQATPVDVPGLSSGVVRVVVGAGHSCALTVGGGVKCWGANWHGQLGDGTATEKLTPVSVSGLLSGVASISAGNNHTCAVLDTGALKCWGYNGYGAVGNNTFDNRAVPTTVVGMDSGVARVSAGGYHTCAVTTAGGLKCWGYDNNGQLGDDISLVNQAAPVSVQGLSTGVSSVSAAEEHTCAVLTTGALKCWGDDSSGQLGDNTMRADVRVPAQVLGLTEGVASVSAGWQHTCAVTTAGGLKCWGNHAVGQLGIGAVASQFIPADVLPPGSGVSRVDAGQVHTCAVIKGGAHCWGKDDTGQLGNDAAKVTQFSPVNVQP